MAAILHGRTMKIICIRKNICFHGKKNLLFLPCNLAAVRNPYRVGMVFPSLSRGVPFKLHLTGKSHLIFQIYFVIGLSL